MVIWQRMQQTLALNQSKLFFPLGGSPSFQTGCIFRGCSSQRAQRKEEPNPLSLERLEFGFRMAGGANGRPGAFAHPHIAKGFQEAGGELQFRGLSVGCQNLHTNTHHISTLMSVVWCDMTLR